ncbi:MAG: transposase [Cyclobacteriaceae bacterium]
MVVTRRIELYVDADQERKSAIFAFLRTLQHHNWLIANKAVSMLWFYQFAEENLMAFDQEQLQQLTTLIETAVDEKVKQPYLKERKQLVNHARKEAKANLREAFGVTYTTLVRRALASETMHKGGLYDLKGGSYLLDGMLRRVNQDFSNDLVDVKQGKKSIRRYRYGLPIYFHNRAIKSFEGGPKKGEYYMNWLNGIRFGLVFGRDKNSRSSEIQKIMDGEYGYGDSAIQLKGKKIFLLLSLKHPVKEANVDPGISIVVDAGMLIPVACQSGEHKQIYGNADELLRFRIQKQQRYRRLQMGLTITHGGRGRKKKLAKLEDLRNLERNWIHTYNHKLSTAVIKYALKNRAGRIVVNEVTFTQSSDPEDQKQFEAKNWAGSELSQMIAYKAKIYGIVVTINKEVERQPQSV